MTIDYTDMSFEELDRLQKDIAKAAETKRNAARGEALAAIQGHIRTFGFTAKDFSPFFATSKAQSAKPVPGPTRTSKPAPMIYANPQDPNQKWSGRGKAPLWIRDATDRTPFLIDPSRAGEFPMTQKPVPSASPTEAAVNQQAGEDNPDNPGFVEPQEPMAFEPYEDDEASGEADSSEDDDELDPVAPSQRLGGAKPLFTIDTGMENETA